MDEKLFGRKYSLIIGRPQSTTELNEISANTKNFETKQLTQAGVRSKVYDGASFVEIVDLDLRAKVKQGRITRGRDREDDILTLRGLSQETKDFIQQGDIVILSAGYEQDLELPLILSGEIVAKSSKTPVAGDEVKLIVSQSFTALRNINVVKSWSPSDANLYRVLKDLTDLIIKAGVDFGSSEVLEVNREALQSQKFVGGYSVEGNVFAVLGKVLEKFNGRYYLVNEVLYVESKNLPALQEVFILRPENLKAPPEISQRVIKKKSKRDIQTGYIFNLYLDGRINVSEKLRVVEGEFEGDYIVSSVEHHMDYEGANWTTKVLCQREVT